MKQYISKFRNNLWKESLKDWQLRQIQSSSSIFETREFKTQFGTTQVISTIEKENLPQLVLIPGFRTCGLYWDISDAVSLYKGKFIVHLIDVIGQPSMSSGISPSVRSLGYAKWLNGLTEAMEIEKASFAGASFGGQLILKLGQLAPEKIDKAFLCNPGGLVNVSLKGILANIPIMLKSSDKNIEQMMRNVALGRKHCLNNSQYLNLFEGIKISIKGFKNGAQFPYKMSDKELNKINFQTYLMLGTDDKMFNFERQIQRAKESIPGFVRAEIFEAVGHAIEVETNLHRKILEILSE